MMSFLDSGGGGGKADPTGGGDPFGGGGSSGGAPGSGGDQAFSGDPSLTGDTSGIDPSLLSGAGLGGGAAGGADLSAGGTTDPLANPQVGAPQSQAPTPGTTPTSFGGVPSSPQTDTQLQQAIKQLSGGRESAAAPSLTQVASRDDIATDAPPPGVGTGTTAANTTTPPTGNVPVGATGQPIPPSTSTTPTPPMATSPGQPPPGGASPEPAVDKPVPPPPPEPKADTTATPPTTADTTGAKPPATGATPPATGATPPATGAAPPGYGGGSPTQQQQLSPAKLIGDVIQAMFGNFSPLLQDITGGAAGGASGDWESAGNPPGVPPWAPGYGPQSRINPNSPQARRIAAQGGRAGRAGGERPPTVPQDTTPPGPSVAQQQGDVQAAIGKAERDPFGATGWPGPGQRDPLAPTAGRSDLGAMPDDVKQVVSTPLAAGNAKGQVSAANYKIGQPSQATVDRSQFLPELKGPRGKDIIYKLAWANNGEVGRDAPLQAKIVQAETAFNRAQDRGQSLEHVLLSVGESPNGYYARDTYKASTKPTKADLDEMYNKILPALTGGSNLSDTGQGPMTGNASNAPGNPLANKQMKKMPGYKLQGGDHYFRENYKGKPIGKFPEMRPQSSLTPPARATGLDMLRGYTQTASLTDQGTVMPEPEDRMRDVNNPPQTTNDPRYEPSWMTGVDPNLTIQNLDRPDNETPGS